MLQSVDYKRTQAACVNDSILLAISIIIIIVVWLFVLFEYLVVAFIQFIIAQMGVALRYLNVAMSC